MLPGMDWNDPRQRNVFFAVHKDLPREAPGSRACTHRALDLCLDASAGVAPVAVLDLGCGPGAQSIDLAARLPEAHIVAIDLHLPFLQDLHQRCLAHGRAGITPVCADMNRLPARPGAWDLVWCEGAAYAIGVAAALTAWRPLLRRGGCAAFTDAVWLTDDPPPAARRFWATEYPDMVSLQVRRRQIADRGWRLLGDFVLPQSAWWDEYYGPMRERIERLHVDFGADPAAAAVLDECTSEIDVYRHHGDSYGYAFFIARPTDGMGD
jgi:SAM-dependent methyltransferase